MKKNLQKYLILIGVLTFSISSFGWAKTNKSDTKPNIIYIYADDSGYGDIGCYGQELIQTPTIDRMARQGMRFTQHYSGSPVCAPARCNLMTGKHNGHSFIRANERVEPHGQIPLEANSVMLSEKLKEAGYATACIGKWGLGIENTEGDPNKRGFDLFYGYYDQVMAHNHFPEYLYRNGKKIALKNEAIWKDKTHWTKGWGSYSTRKEEWTQDLFLKEALGFIDQNAGKPFFLYLPVVIPHVNGEAPKGFKHEAPILEMYENKPWSREEKSYASGITTLDSHINIILDKLKELGLDKNTLVIFTSDNGYQEPQIFESNGRLKGRKRDLYEGGIRMPHVAYWPGKIKPGTVSDHLSAQYDFMATACEIAGIKCPSTDGISYLPTLIGEKQKEHDFLYFEYVTGSGQKAVRMKKWKAVQLNIHKNENSPIELYNMESDIYETKNVAAENPDIIKKVQEIFNKEHVKSNNPRFQFKYEKSPVASLSSSSHTVDGLDIIIKDIHDSFQHPVKNVPEGKAGQEYHVAPSGSDENPGTEAQPFASLTVARDALRTGGILGKEPCTVIIHGGTYRLKESLKLNQADSGAEGAEVTYRAVKGEKVTLTGMQKLNVSWGLWKDGIYKARLKTDEQIDQLFINGKRQHMARYPDHGAGLVMSDGKVKLNVGHVPYDGSAPDAWDSRAKHWTDPVGAFLHGIHLYRWGSTHFRVLGKNADGTLKIEGGWQNNRAKTRKHKTYRMSENVFEELDAPGEWYYNRKTGWLYYYPAEDIDLTGNVLVEAVFNLRHLVEIHGDIASPVSTMILESCGNGLNGMMIETPETTNPVHHIRIEGISFTGTARTFMDTKEPLLRSDWCIYRGGAMYLRGTEDIAITGCSFEQLGGNAVFVDGYNRRVSVVSGLFTENGASDVSFVGSPAAVRNPLFTFSKTVSAIIDTIDTRNGPKTDDYPEDCLVEDCLMSHCGRFEKQVAGVNISMSSRITVRHNTVHHTPRAALNICDGTWGGHIIEWNDCFETVLETHDHGAFNSWGRDRYWTTCSPSGPGEVNKQGIPLISRNLAKYPDMMVWDAYQLSIIRNNRMQCDHGWDIDLDDGSTNYEIYNNLCLRGGIKTREGYYRKVYNNVIVASRGYTCNVPYPKPTFDDCQRNIFFGGTYHASNPTLWGGVRDRNFFHNPEFSEVQPAVGVQPLTEDDTNSVVGNARFVAPESGDFTVEGDSPALAIGYKNFPMTGFGVISAYMKALAPEPRIVLPKEYFDNKVRAPKGAVVLGAEVDNLDTEEELTAYGAPSKTGVILRKVPKDSQMAEFGFRTDDVIFKINNKRIHNRGMLADCFQKSKAGQEFKAVILRVQEEASISFTIPWKEKGEK